MWLMSNCKQPRLVSSYHTEESAFQILQHKYAGVRCPLGNTAITGKLRALKLPKKKAAAPKMTPEQIEALKAKKAAEKAAAAKKA